MNRFTKYWCETMGRDAWWSAGQTGYYYSNRRNCPSCFQSQTHTHIYRMENLDGRNNGIKEIHWARKKVDFQYDTGIDRMPYNDIAGWLLHKNDEIGADFPCKK